MIDINELRLLVQDYKLAGSPVFVQAADMNEILDRLDAAEKEVEIERMRLAACGVAALGYFEGCAEEYISASLNDVLALRAKIEAMEQQVPICRAEDLRHAEILLPSLGLMPEDKLYALPGAKGEEK